MKLPVLLLSLALFLSGFRLEAAPKPVPGPIEITTNAYEGSIARMTVALLERAHYSRKTFDDAVSSRFLDRYIDTLDGMRLHFIESDLQQFEAYRATLDDLTVKRGDTTPAYVMFNRLLERMEQRTAYVEELLRSEKFDFTGNDRYLLNRREAARAKTLEAARAMWKKTLRYEYLQELLALEGKKGDHAKEIRKKIQSRYQRLLRNFHDLSRDDVFEIYLTALAHVYDPHSDYMGHAQLENFAINMKLSLFGIGAMLESDDGYCKIKQLVPGGPAARSKKLKPEDKIVAVAQGDGDPVDVIDMKLTKVVELIRGPKDTQVRLTIIPVDAPDPSVRRTVVLTRDEVKLEDQEAKARLIEIPGAEAGGGPLRVGILDLPSFYADFQLDGKKGGERKSTTVDCAKLIRKLKEEKIGGLVLDLRRNGGGALEEAINLTGLFIKKGPVVQVKNPQGKVIQDEDTDPAVLYDGPLVVLTSRFSASASEILAGALQDYGRALIVGDSSTHGKGTVQSLRPLKPMMEASESASPHDPGAVKITILKFYRPSGSSTQLKGVVPDIILPSVNNYAEVGEVSLENPLPWDEVPPARFDKVNRVQDYVAELRRRSERRLETDRDFSFVREDIEQYRRLLADKSVSLNEAQRLKEKREAEGRRDVRLKELKARHARGDGMTTYEINLAAAGKPGLPGPVVPKADVQEKAPSPVLSPEEEMEDEVKKNGLPDSTMDEARRILVDYISLTTSAHRTAGARGN